MKKISNTIILLTIASLLLAACNIPKPTPTPSMDTVRTAAAQTVEALTTQIVSTQPQQPQPSDTPQVADTQAATQAPQATATTSVNATATSSAACDQAGFVEETIPDRSKFSAGSVFTKTWTLKNTGSCTWNANYAVVFSSGVAMNAPASQQLTTGTVAPGQSLVITMALTTPATPGTYRADFKLRNAGGVLFGIGPENKTFWAEIDVVTASLNLVESYCSAQWTSAAGTLPCPGKDGSSNGFVYYDDEPMLEGYYQDNEPAIWVAPQNVTNGYIKGIYPVLKIPAGHKFHAIIGCASGSSNCDVKMTLNYIEAGGPMQTLAIWHEVNDGMFQKVSYDLSSFANRSIQIVLIVDSNGSPVGDKVHWFAARIAP